MPSTWDLGYPLDPECCEECRIARSIGKGIQCNYHRLERRRQEEIEKSHGEFCECEQHKQMPEKGRCKVNICDWPECEEDADEASFRGYCAFHHLYSEKATGMAKVPDHILELAFYECEIPLWDLEERIKKESAK